jgi:hypothetical protein
VPDPDQFNSADFNREAFIAEAKQSNDKLMAQMSTGISPYQQYSVHKRSLASSSNVSPVSNLSTSSSSYTSPSTSNDLENTTNDDEFYLATEDFSANRKFTTSKSTKRSRNQHLNASVNKNIDHPIATTPPKYTSFSINSILIKDEKNNSTANANQSAFDHSLPLIQNYLHYYHQQASSWTAFSNNHSSSQMNFFYNYLTQLNQKQILSNLNANMLAFNESNGSSNFDNSS